MKPRRPRLWVVLLGALAGLAVIIVGYARLRGPDGFYADTFDTNLMQSQPLIGGIVEADPALRALFLRRTSVAYSQGGWPAATRIFAELVSSEINAYAGDQETLDCNAAWRDVLLHLRAAPHVCRAYLDRHYEDPAVQAAMAPAAAACGAMTLDGGHRRLTRSRPDVLGDADFRALTAHNLETLTPAERATLTDASSDDAAYCQAGIKRSEAESRLPPDTAARYVRTQFRATAAITTDTPRPAPAPEAADSLHCAAPGTLFTLNMEGQDGLPITWESLGRSGWDCRLRSSASGERGMWGDDRANPLRLMGELAVGKTTRTTTVLQEGEEQTATWTVTGFDRFWMPWGPVGAYTLEEDVTEGSRRHFTVTHYWSPELGFELGQRAVAQQGSLPDWMAPDWQLVAMEEPGVTTERGATLAKSAAAAEIRFAMERAEAIHPNLFWYADRAAVRSREDAVIAALPDPATAMDVYLALSDITGLLGDGHISLSHPAGRRGDVLATYRKAGGKLFLALVKPAQTGLEIQWTGAEGLAAGDILTTINGQDAQAVFARAAALESGEPAFQQRSAGLEFPTLLWDLGIQPPFRLTGMFGGLPGQLELPGQATPPRTAASAAPDDQGIRKRDLPDGIVALDFDRMTADATKFHTRLSELFTQIAAANAKGLIIDLRRNGGGNPALGDDLLDFITGRPHRDYASTELRASPECREYFTNKYGPKSGSSQSIADLADGATQHWDIPVQPAAPNPLRFTGPVAVLIGPGTFSAADILASTISDFHLATLVGRDTAEIPTNFGDACPVRLPRTGIVLRVPSLYMVRAGGDAANREDVHPDILVPAADDESRDDADVTAARQWLRARTDP